MHSCTRDRVWTTNAQKAHNLLRALHSNSEYDHDQGLNRNVRLEINATDKSPIPNNLWNNLHMNVQ